MTLSVSCLEKQQLLIALFGYFWIFYREAYHEFGFLGTEEVGMEDVRNLIKI